MKAYMRSRAALLGLSAVVIATLVPGRVSSQETAGSTTINSTFAGYLGILTMRCDCTLLAAAEPRDRIFVFRSPPVVTSMDSRSPGANILRRGDVITHIDGRSLLTSSGAQHFAQIQPGESVNLTFRRQGKTMQASIVATAIPWNDSRAMGNTTPEVESGYTVVWQDPPAEPAFPATPAVPAQPAPSPRPARAAAPAMSPRVWAVVTPEARAAIAAAPSAPAAPATPGVPPRPPAASYEYGVVTTAPSGAPGVWALEVPSSPASPSGWFGFSIRCNNCGWSSSNRPGASPVWESETAPEISMVAGGSPAARAGLRPGDVITHIDGVSILTPSGSRRFGGVVPGQKVKLTVRRDRTTLTREMTLVRRPEVRAAIAAGAPSTRPPRVERRPLRYTGKFDDVSVEVWSSGGPTVERIGDTMVISVGGTVVKLKLDPAR